MTGNKMIDNILMGICTLAALAMTGVFVYTEMIFEKTLPSEEDELIKLKSEAKNRTIIEPYKMEKMILNLQSRGQRLRFLDVVLHLVPFRQEQNKILDENSAVIKDAVIDIASSMTPGELNTIAGRLLLESRIKKRILSQINKDLIKEIYFSKFVIQ